MDVSWLDSEQITEEETAATSAKGDESTQLVPQPEPILSKRDKQRLRYEQSKNKLSSKWFSAPLSEQTEEHKRDIRLLKLRGALDSKTFFKKVSKDFDPTKLQLGTVVTDPREYYSSRVYKRDAKATFAEEILADKQLKTQRQKRFRKIQEKSAIVLRSGQRKPTLPRLKKPNQKR